MGMFNSPFEKLTVDNQQKMTAAVEITAMSVSKGGELFEIFSKMLTTLKQIEKNTRAKKSKGGGKSGGSGAGTAVMMGLIGGRALKGIGKGLALIADSINKFTDKPKDIVEKMTAVAAGINEITQIGPNIVKFAGYLLLATPMLVIGALAAPLFAVSLLIITGALMLASKPLSNKKTQQTLLALGGIGRSIFAFGGWMALSLLVYPFALIALPMVALVILGVGLVFYAIDKLGIDKSMRDTGRSLMFAGLSIIALGASIALFSLIMSSVGDPWSTLLLVGGTILGIAVAMGLAGKFDKHIKKGAMTMIIAALPILIIAFALKVFTDAVPPTSDGWESLGQVASVIAGLGVEMALAGAAAVVIIPGAIAMMAAGLALLVISIGLKPYSKFFKDGTMEKLLADSGEVTSGFLGIGGGRKMSMMEWSLTSLANSFTFSPVKIASMYASSPALILVGLSLLSISAGLKDFAKLFKGGAMDTMLADSGEVTEGFLGFGGGRMMSMMEWSMLSLARSFTLPALSIGSMYLSAPALILAGASLITIAEGIAKFQKIAEKTDLPSLNENVNIIVSSLADTFGEIGVKFPGGKKGLFDSIFGGGTQSAVADGISSTMGMGEALTNIAMGVQNMANLRFPSEYDPETGKAIAWETMQSDAPKKVAENITTIVDSLSTTFGDIGKKYPGGKNGFWGSVFGSSQSAVADGVSSVMGMGEAITNIAMGVQDMANLRFPTEYDPETGKAVAWETVDIASKVKDVGNNINLILLGEDKKTGGLVGMFKSIGEGDKNAPDKGYYKHKSYLMGVRMIQGVGEPIKNLALGIQQMAEMRFATDWDDETGEPTEWLDAKDIPAKLKKVQSNIKLILIGDGKENHGLVGIFKKIGAQDDSGWFSASTIENGARIAGMISKPISAIASSAEALMSDKWTAEGASEKIKSIVGSLAETTNAGGLLAVNPLKSTAYYLGKIAEHSDKFKTFTDSYTQYVTDFIRYKDAVNEFDEDNLKLTTEMFQGLSYLAKTEDAIENMADQLTGAIEKLAEMIANLGGTIAEGSNTPAAGAPTTIPAQKDAEGNVVQPAIDISPLISAIEELEDRLNSPLRVFVEE